MSGYTPRPQVFIDRGDPAAHDFTLAGADFTTDGTWRDLDLSGVVPAGVKGVLLGVRIQDDLTQQIFDLRANGNSNVFNRTSIYTQVANAFVRNTVSVPCDSNRVVEYRASNTTWTLIEVTINGWWF